MKKQKAVIQLGKIDSTDYKTFSSREIAAVSPRL